jgi:hypothetical protein
MQQDLAFQRLVYIAESLCLVTSIGTKEFA